MKKVDFPKLQTKGVMRKTLKLYQTNAKSRTQMTESYRGHDPEDTKSTGNYVRDGESHGGGWKASTW